MSAEPIEFQRHLSAGQVQSLLQLAAIHKKMAADVVRMINDHENLKRFVNTEIDKNQKSFSDWDLKLTKTVENFNKILYPIQQSMRDLNTALAQVITKLNSLEEKVEENEPPPVILPDFDALVREAFIKHLEQTLNQLKGAL